MPFILKGNDAVWFLVLCTYERKRSSFNVASDRPQEKVRRTRVRDRDGFLLGSTSFESARDSQRG